LPRASNDEIDDVRFWLRRLFNDFTVRMTTGHEMPDFRPGFLDILNHACAASVPFLTYRQRLIVQLLYTSYVDQDGNRVRLTAADVGERLGIDERTVRREHRAALEKVAARVSL
jgi:hypothetical protein